MRKLVVLIGALVILIAALGITGCGGDDDDAASDGGGRAIEASTASITVDGDTADWEGISALDVTLEPIQGFDVETKQATVRVAHDGDSVYVLLEVEDDYNWDPEDVHLSAASAVMWGIEDPSGPHMGAEEPTGTPGVGMVDIWHWELECAAGEEHGGAVHGPGDGDPGNDGTCNFDDEWSTDAITREDDNSATAENSLLGCTPTPRPMRTARGSSSSSGRSIPETNRTANSQPVRRG